MHCFLYFVSNYQINEWVIIIYSIIIIILLLNWMNEFEFNFMLVNFINIEKLKEKALNDLLLFHIFIKH